MSNPISQHGIQSSALDSEMSNLLRFSVAPQTTPAPIRLSLSQLTTLRWSLSEELVQLKQSGFDAIGLWRPKLGQYGEDRAAEAMTRARLQASSLSFAGGFTGGCGLSYVEAVADGRQAIEQARIVGAKTVVMVGGSTNGHTFRHSRRLVTDGLRQLADYAEQAQVTLSLLPMHQVYSKRWTFLNGLDQALEVLSQIDHPSVGLAFNTYHLCGESRLHERIPEIVPFTNIVQLSDCSRTPTSEFDHQLPGDGIIPLSELIQAFQLAGYAGYFDIQVWSGNVWKSNYTHLVEQCQATVKGMSLSPVK